MFLTYLELLLPRDDPPVSQVTSERDIADERGVRLVDPDGSVVGFVGVMGELNTILLGNTTN